MNGYNGKLLFVDLGSQKIEERPLDEAVARNFLGGAGLGAKIIYDEMPANTPWDAPESMIGFMSGPANETGTLLGGRYMFVSKSPVTNGWNDANSGGFFGPSLKKAGYDAVFVKGISQKPVYIFIDEGKVSFHDASALWGKNMKVSEVEEAIFAELGDDKISIAQIGPAGERKSLMAAVINDGHRAAARGGGGAVMGSKNLKALAVRGSNKFPVKDRDAQLEAHKEIAGWQKDGPTAGLIAGFKELGTSCLYEGGVLSGDSGIKNWLGSALDVTEDDIKAPLGEEAWKTKKYACSTCPIGCGAMLDISSGSLGLKHAARAEYETIGMFGCNMLNSDPMVINQCNTLVNEYGLDTISAGATVAWAMECYNDGTLSKEDLDGIELTWGNKDAIVKMTEKVCKGEGVGAILQHGSRFAANHFGKGSHALVTASGIEIPQHDSRWAPGLARMYQYDPSPGRHTKGGMAPPHGNAPPEVKYNFDDKAVPDVDGVIASEIQNDAGICVFAEFSYSPGAHIALINAITGFNYSEEDRRKLGLRIFIIRHAFNLREGFRRKDWTLSDRIIGVPPMTEGPNTGRTIDTKKLADNFFELLGFDQDAVPLKKTLEEIGGLENVIKDLYPG